MTDNKTPDMQTFTDLSNERSRLRYSQTIPRYVLLIDEVTKKEDMLLKKHGWVHIKGIYVSCDTHVLQWQQRVVSKITQSKYTIASMNE